MDEKLPPPSDPRQISAIARALTLATTAATNARNTLTGDQLDAALHTIGLQLGLLLVAIAPEPDRECDSTEALAEGARALLQGQRAAMATTLQPPGSTPGGDLFLTAVTRAGALIIDPDPGDERL